MTPKRRSWGRELTPTEMFLIDTIVKVTLAILAILAMTLR